MTSTTFNARSTNRYLADSLSTASPAALLVMLYDRLVLDLQRAEEAQLAGNRGIAHENLVHAQAIVLELESSLDPEGWEGGAGLKAIYAWLLTELPLANVSGDASRTGACREMTAELAEAWRQAALEHLTAAAGGRHGTA
ncbi:flagellar export chaperone FliS [Kineococcus rhizosphaerae]|uniref:Flagellar protein FliS n=1 Tax=Kineococcus rhizosphaerae TaxID=559628 RepID=A0A2T0RAQ5_9ACTN|nr:flagellar export chaperone FliS [Kineococcus rhizosphaerae]PRY18245.1 flagellar protein FliS [Kineococcus rhizosphaerae]